MCFDSHTLQSQSATARKLTEASNRVARIHSPRVSPTLKYYLTAITHSVVNRLWEFILTKTWACTHLHYPEDRFFQSVPRLWLHTQRQLITHHSSRQTPALMEEIIMTDPRDDLPRQTKGLVHWATGDCLVVDMLISICSYYYLRLRAIHCIVQDIWPT